MFEKTIKDKKITDNGQDQEAGVKIGLRKPKPLGNDANENDALWVKVESITNAAKEAYQSGKSNFRDVVESLIATLQDMLANEEGNGGLGGLTGGPEMDIPPEPDQTKGQ